MLFLLLFFVSSSSTFDYTNHMPPIRMELCKHNTWVARHYIVYNCNFSTLHDVDEAQRDITPFACDPTNGIDTKMRRKLLFLGEERLGDDGFVYECAKDAKTGSVTYRAKACHVDNERFNAGHFIKGKQNIIFLCYRDLDNIIRLRVRHPVHTACNPDIADPRCKQGIGQAIYNSAYGYGEPFAFNPVSGETLTVAISPTTTNEIFNLSDDHAVLTSSDLLSAMKGQLDPTATRPPASTTPFRFITTTTQSTTTVSLNASTIEP